MFEHSLLPSLNRGKLHMQAIGLLLAYEVCRDLEMEEVSVQTPLELVKVPKIVGKKLCFISILRAGNGLLDGMLDLVPSARVGLLVPMGLDRAFHLKVRCLL